MKRTLLALLGCASIVPGADAVAAAAAAAQATEEFCLRGEFDLGVRLQGLRPAAGERYPTSWCVVTEVDGRRARFSAAGHSNADMQGDFTVSYLAPDRVRIVNPHAPPDLEFRGTLAAHEAQSVRRLDPRRLVAELGAHPEWIAAEHADGTRELRWPGSEAVASVSLRDGRLRWVRTVVDLPLRGRVPVTWNWTWPADATDGVLEVTVDGERLFRATGRRRVLAPEEAAAVWQPSGGLEPREIPGKAWPARVHMTVHTLTRGVHLVRGVRTGFQHLVVETEGGLIVADAPAGWVELHQVPPADLVPGLGVSGLSERLVDFLQGHWPGTPIRAVILTHAHDDHAGGARAFAAAGAQVYAPAAVAGFIERALNRSNMPPDRLSLAKRTLRVRPVGKRLELADPGRPVVLLPMAGSPHVESALGLHVPTADIFFQSDLHVPGDDSPEPRAERSRTECWFAAWGSAHLPSSTTVHNSHGQTALTVRQIAAYLEHERCRA